MADASTNEYPQRWPGYCPVCAMDVEFVAWDAHYRDCLLCGRCATKPRERALVSVLTELYPNWRDLEIHESSPSVEGISDFFRSQAKHYVETQYDQDIAFGSMHEKGYRSENLESQTFEDERFDIVITQDVFEHIFAPDKAIKEITRTLKPGGAHIMTAPLVRGANPSRRRATIDRNGKITHLLPPDYHGNPISDDGALVTIDWGWDIAGYLGKKSGFPTMIYMMNDKGRGIVGPLLEVVVTQKLAKLAI